MVGGVRNEARIAKQGRDKSEFVYFFRTTRNGVNWFVGVNGRVRI